MKEEEEQEEEEALLSPNSLDFFLLQLPHMQQQLQSLCNNNMYESNGANNFVAEPNLIPFTSHFAEECNFSQSLQALELLLINQPHPNMQECPTHISELHRAHNRRVAQLLPEPHFSFNPTSGKLNPSTSEEEHVFLSAAGACSSTVDLQSDYFEERTCMSNKRELKIGPFSTEERKVKLERYWQKKRKRNFDKRIQYECRKTLADSRPRVKGRFARSGDVIGTASPGKWFHEIPQEEDEDEEDDQIMMEEQVLLLDNCMDDKWTHMIGIDFELN